MNEIRNISRRSFLKTGAAGSSGLVLGFLLPTTVLPTHTATNETPTAAALAPDAWLRIDADETVTVWIGKSDMGQGVRTSIPMIVADELEADWTKVRIEQAVTDPKFGNMGTAGSSSTRSQWMPLRKTGATARAMLLTAAAQTWGVPENECAAMNGAVTHTPSGKKLTYGALVETAATLPVPENPPLKDPADFRYIGRRMPMLDTPARVTGKAVYGLDVRVPGMLYASVERCPEFGGTLESYDASRAMKVPGVRRVIEIAAIGPPTSVPSGVAVVAESTWAAMKGRQALDVTWAPGPHAGESSDTLRSHFEAITAAPGEVVRDTGNALAVLEQAAQTIEAVYELPYLAHATMEPMNCVVDAREDGADVWIGTQFPTSHGQAVARALGLSPDQVKVHTTLLGGGFGRRGIADVPVETALISKAAGTPVQVVWTREDDMQHDFYRPANFHRFRAGLDADGNPIAWFHRASTASIGSYMFNQTQNAGEGETRGAWDIPYAIPNIRVEYTPATSGIPRGWWRSVEHSYTGFVVNAFMDEVAAAAGRDPYAFRMALLDQVDRDTLYAELGSRYRNLGPHMFDLDRYRNVLQTAAEKAGWGTPLPKGRGRGIAVQWAFYTYVAEVAEVTVDAQGGVKVDRVMCVMDCGRVVNPQTVEAQMAGSILYGLTAALKGNLEVDRGRIVQSNFHDYEILRMNEAPVIEVHLVESDRPPSGAGEPALPPAAPALTNAIFDATGQRIRRLPVRIEGVS